MDQACFARPQAPAGVRLSSKLHIAEPSTIFAFMTIRDPTHHELSRSESTSLESKQSFGEMQSQAELGTEVRRGG